MSSATSAKRSDSRAWGHRLLDVRVQWVEGARSLWIGEATTFEPLEHARLEVVAELREEVATQRWISRVVDRRVGPIYSIGFSHDRLGLVRLAPRQKGLNIEQDR